MNFKIYNELKLKKTLLAAIILSTLVARAVYAEEIPPVGEATNGTVSIHLTINTSTQTIYDTDMDVEACNSDNSSTEDLKVTPYCAILQSGVESVWDWSWAPGAFITSINDISGYTSQDENGNDVYHYWSWSLNSSYAETSLNEYELGAGDLISLDFVDPVGETPPEDIPPAENPSSGGGGSGSSRKKITFDTDEAVSFLYSRQKENGSWDEDIYTDWTAVSLASLKNQKTEPIIKLTKYLSENEVSGGFLTDYERRAMALMAMGLNPYNTNYENYIKKITDSFDGKQFGNVQEDNDDIFALIVLQNAGFTQTDKMIIDDIAFILSKQKENGSWDESVDMTSAAIQAIIATAGENIENELAKAKEFLKDNQEDNGGWGNVSSTAWVIGGILALSEKPEDWEKDDNTPLDYFAKNQGSDGGIKNDNAQNKIWETAYALTAFSGKTWNQIMQKFEKPKEEITLEKREQLEEKLEKILALLEEKKTTENKTLKLAAAKNIASNTETTRTLEGKNETEKMKNSAKQNTATIINSLGESDAGTKKIGWFRKLLNEIFGNF